MNDFCSKKYVLIVENHPLVAEAIKMAIADMSADAIVKICNNAELALEAFRSVGSWFRIFVDLDVPGSQGLSLARRFVKLGVAERCAIITDFYTPQWKSEIMEMGILGYIVKTTSVEDFRFSLSEVWQGRKTYHYGLLSDASVAPIRLTRRQQDMLSLIYRGCSSKQIAAQLALSVGTVDNHVAGLLRVLKVGTRTHAIAKAVELGILQ